MKKIVTSSLYIIIGIFAIIFLASVYRFNLTKGSVVSHYVPARDYKNASYFIAGSDVHLTEGKSVTITELGSSSKTVTEYFGNDLMIDLNNDDMLDVVFLVTQTIGGNSPFFYVVAAIKTPEGYLGSKGTLLGDRIAPQTTQAGKENTVIVNYAIRNPQDPKETQPSLGKSLYLRFSTTTMDFGEIVQDFEGEADPSLMKLTMKPWKWVEVQMNDGNVIVPKKPDLFSITFNDKGGVTVTTDCNTASGSYVARDNKLTFGPFMSTKMFCEESQERVFLQTLENISSYLFTSKGELILEIKMDSGTMKLR